MSMILYGNIGKIGSATIFTQKFTVSKIARAYLIVGKTVMKNRKTFLSRKISIMLSFTCEVKKQRLSLCNHFWLRQSSLFIFLFHPFALLWYCWANKLLWIPFDPNKSSRLNKFFLIQKYRWSRQYFLECSKVVYCFFWFFYPVINFGLL